VITDYRYLLDNNVLSKISVSDRRGPFMKSHCRVPAEVLYEAQGYPDGDELSALLYPTTPAVLRALVEVMATVNPADTSLIDLYHNRGNADPILVACAIVARDENASLLFGEAWSVVSDDHAVQLKATDFNIGFLTSGEFLVLVEASRTAAP
jgi:hypothetical protein